MALEVFNPAIPTGTEGTGGVRINTSTGNNGLLISEADGIYDISLPSVLNTGGGNLRTINLADTGSLIFDSTGRLIDVTTTTGIIDQVYITRVYQNAAQGQTVINYTLTNQNNYIINQCLLWINGVFIEQQDNLGNNIWTNTTKTQITLTFPLNVNDTIAIHLFAAVPYSIPTSTVTTYTASMGCSVISSSNATTTTIVLSNYPIEPINNGDQIAFTPAGTAYGVLSRSGLSITLSTLITAPIATPFLVSKVRTRGVPFKPFSAAFNVPYTANSTFSIPTSTGFSLVNRHELVFMDGVLLTAEDYSVSGSDIIITDSNQSGNITVVNFTIGASGSNVIYFNDYSFLTVSNTSITPNVPRTSYTFNGSVDVATAPVYYNGLALDNTTGVADYTLVSSLANNTITLRDTDLISTIDNTSRITVQSFNSLGRI